MNTAPRPAAFVARWQRLPPTQRRALVIAVLVLLAFTLAWTSLLPAWRALRELPQQRHELESRWARMRVLAEQAKSLRAMPRSTPDEARQALAAATREQLGQGGRIQFQGDEAVVTLTGVRPDLLELWLAQARSQARVLPTQARLQRNAQGLWDGVVTFGLPQA